MKKVLIASATLAAIGLAAPAVLAADRGIIAPAPAYTPPASDWTGFYLGGHAGYGWGHDPFTDTELPTNGGVPGVQVFNINPVTIAGSDPNGGVYGGHFGYNQQWGNWVGGVEFDISGTSMKASAAGSSTGTVSTTTTTTTAIPVAPFITATTTTATQQITNTLGREDNIDLLASARARLGTLVWGNTLIYGTGGLAWTRFVSTRSQTQNIFGQAGTTAVSVVTSSGTGVGTSFWWVAGVGGETKLYNSNWLFRVEYLHYDFGDQGGFNGTGITRSVDGTSVTTSSSSLTNGHLTADVVRAGISYKFGGSPI